jgi:hypothetical protein
VYQAENYSIDSVDLGTQNSVVLDAEYTLNFSNDKKIGTNDYILSELERLSAFKLQSKLRINQSTPSGFTYTYEIWNNTSNEWVSCNWSDSDNYWSAFPKLKGGYITTHRSAFNVFDFGTDFRADSSFVQIRGTKNYHPAIAFDYENKTDLSHFVSNSNKVKIRMNITSTDQPFELSFDNLGIQACYWSVVPQSFDKYGIFNYDSSNFHNTLLKSLVVQDFIVLNGTADSKFDVMAIISAEESSWIGISNIYRLYDLFNSNSYSFWSNLLSGSV